MATVGKAKKQRDNRSPSTGKELLKINPIKPIGCERWDLTNKNSMEPALVLKYVTRKNNASNDYMSLAVQKTKSTQDYNFNNNKIKLM